MTEVYDRVLSRLYHYQYYQYEIYISYIVHPFWKNVFFFFVVVFRDIHTFLAYLGVSVFDRDTSLAKAFIGMKFPAYPLGEIYEETCVVLQSSNS